MHGVMAAGSGIVYLDAGKSCADVDDAPLGMLKSYLKVLKPVVGLAAMNEQVKLLRDVVKSLDDAERSYYAGYVVTDLVYFEEHEFQ